MKRVATAVILIPIVLAAVLWLPNWIFSLGAGAIALLATDEFLGIAEAAAFKPARYVTMIFVALLFVAFPLRSNLQLHEAQWVRVAGGMYWATPRFPALLVALIIASAFASLASGMRRDDLRAAFAGSALSVLALPYIALTLGSLVLLKDLEFGPFLLIYLFIVVWSGDIFAYYAGRALGKHKLAPRISPGKTWEGAAASFVGSIVLGTLFFHFAAPITALMFRMHALANVSTEPRSLATIVGLSAVLNVVAQVGDLLESFVKRAAGVKDSGVMVPGHGGLLDRIDALLFAAPLLWYYALITNF
ncbi:MAG TPA: phosphatidate cytidylyltransferase [Terriglobales bacterium]|nr:phosphatidate cytidylyltransferase [Terriglobales bacterium]